MMGKKVMETIILKNIKVMLPDREDFIKGTARREGEVTHVYYLFYIDSDDGMSIAISDKTNDKELAVVADVARCYWEDQREYWCGQKNLEKENECDHWVGAWYLVGRRARGFEDNLGGLPNQIGYQHE